MNNPFGSTNKDNLTDLISAIPQSTPASTPAPSAPASTPAAQPQASAPQQVVASTGEVVTLGQNQPKK